MTQWQRNYEYLLLYLLFYFPTSSFNVKFSVNTSPFHCGFLKELKVWKTMFLSKAGDNSKGFCKQLSGLRGSPTATPSQARQRLGLWEKRLRLARNRKVPPQSSFLGIFLLKNVILTLYFEETMNGIIIPYDLHATNFLLL